MPKETVPSRLPSPTGALTGPRLNQALPSPFCPLKKPPSQNAEDAGLPQGHQRTGPENAGTADSPPLRHQDPSVQGAHHSPKAQHPARGPQAASLMKIHWGKSRPRKEVPPRDVPQIKEHRGTAKAESGAPNHQQLLPECLAENPKPTADAWRDAVPLPSVCRPQAPNSERGHLQPRSPST